MQEVQKPDVTVIGGGIVGICSALSLLEEGLTVALVERNEPGQGASFGNAGTISPWSIIPQSVPGIWKKLPGMLLGRHGAAGISLRHAPGYLPWLIRFLRLSDPDSVRRIADSMHVLCAESIQLYQKHLKSTGREDLVRDSMYVHVYRRAEDVSLRSLGNSIRSDKGASLEQIDGAELRKIEPALSTDFKAAVLIHGQMRALNPGEIGTVLSKKFQSLGGRLIRANVKGLSRAETGGWTVQTEQGSIETAKVVVSAGAWSAKLLRPLGVRVPLAAERGYHLSFPNTGLTLNNSVMDAENHVVANAMEPGLRIAGIADFAGPDSPPNPKHYATLRYCASAMIPDLGTHKAEEWMGVRPSFPDSLPLIEELPNHSGLFAAFGHSHYGLMMAPKTGQLVAHLVAKRPTNIDLSVFGSARFKASVTKPGSLGFP